MARPIVKLKCPADINRGSNERTVEFFHRGHGDHEDAGGLINLRRTTDGRLYVCTYRCDGPVVVQVGSHVQYQLPLDGRCVGLTPNVATEVHGLVPLLREVRNLYGDAVFDEMVRLAKQEVPS
jgi:hypothetical protein